MGYTAFGYEQEDGSITYGLLNLTCHLDELEDCIKERDFPNDLEEIDRMATSVEEYFDNMIFTYEDTRWRILYMLDGTTRCRLYTMPGTFIYKIQQIYGPTVS